MTVKETEENIEKSEKFLRLLKQPSTIKGIIGMLGVAGLCVSPENTDKIIAGVGIIYSAYQIKHDRD